MSTFIYIVGAARHLWDVSPIVKSSWSSCKLVFVSLNPLRIYSKSGIADVCCSRIEDVCSNFSSFFFSSENWTGSRMENTFSYMASWSRIRQNHHYLFWHPVISCCEDRLEILQHWHENQLNCVLITSSRAHYCVCNIDFNKFAVSFRSEVEHKDLKVMCCADQMMIQSPPNNFQTVNSCAEVSRHSKIPKFLDEPCLSPIFHFVTCVSAESPDAIQMISQQCC